MRTRGSWGARPGIGNSPRLCPSCRAASVPACAVSERQDCIMVIYRGSWPPGGDGRSPPNRANGSFPPRPGEPHGSSMPPSKPPGRFVPPSDPYYRGPANGHPSNPPPPRNGHNPPPPYGPYRAPMGPLGGTAGYLRDSDLQAPNPGRRPPSSGSIYAPRRHSESYPPNGFVPRGPAEPRHHGPPASPPRGRGDQPVPPPPPRYPQEVTKERPAHQPNSPPAARLGNGAASGRRSFTPVQDYLAGTDVATDRPRGESARPAGYLRESDLQAPSSHNNVLPANPLPLGE